MNENKMIPLRRLDMTSLSADAQTLFVLGNGFDIMHGAKSSYWDFRQSLGAHNRVRENLERYLKVPPEQLWCNLEDSLAKLNAGMMLDLIDMWLDINGCYTGDDSAASFYQSVDTAFLPVEILLNDFPRMFRAWVERLQCDGEKSLDGLLCRDAGYLTFNYTDFPETLYGISPERICYIHGNRKRGKHGRKEEIILGHVPNVDYLAGYQPSSLVPKYKSKRKRALLEAAMEIAVDRWIDAYEQAFTKHTPEIIEKNRGFFASLGSVAKVITIGHSLSVVDYPYFRQIAARSRKDADWFLGFHSDRDLENVYRFVAEMEIAPDRVGLFRT